MYDDNLGRVKKLGGKSRKQSRKLRKVVVNLGVVY
jgi:hypothetical protein